MPKLNLELSNYELRWIEDAQERQIRGFPLDDGVLCTIGQILLDKLE